MSRDRTVEDTFFIAFTTRAFATGIPTVLAGTPVVSAYEDAGLTQITAGITLGVDHDAVVGLNMLTLVATGANGYESGKDYNLVITTGTVGGVSVVGEVVGQFSLGLSAAAVDLANGTDGLGAIKTDTAAILVDTADMQPKLGAPAGASISADILVIDNFVDGIESTLGTPAGADMSADIAAVKVDTAAILVDTGTDGVLLAATATSAQLVDDVWDEVLTGATHNIDTSSGRRLRQIAGTIFSDGTAQSGAANSIQLAAGDVSTDDQFIRAKVILVGGTGSGQEAIITGSTAATDTLTTTPVWITNPDATSDYEIIPGQAHTTVSNGGYDDGNVFVDVVNGVAGTVRGVNGTSTNKSSVLADARTIADAEGIRKFRIEGGGAFSLDQSYTDWIFEHINASQITLNSQDISGAVFMRSGITGIGTATTRSVFELCGIDGVTVDLCNFLQCGFSGTTTLTSEDRYLAWDCFENSASLPVIDVAGDGVTATTLLLVNFSGRIELQNMTSVDAVCVTGQAAVTLNANCSGGTLLKAGDLKITDNSGNVTITTGETADILTDTADMQPKLGAPAADISADIAAVKVDSAAILIDTGTSGVIVTGTPDVNMAQIDGSAEAASDLSLSALTIVTGAAEAGTLSTTQMTSDLAEATDDHYNGRIVIWTSGVLKDQATDITDYSGATGLLTFTAVTEAPSAADTFVIV